MSTFLLNLAYRGEVLFSRLQGIASDDPRFNGEYLLVRRLRSEIRAAVDAGANRGEWTARVLRECPSARIDCIEADPDNAAGLRRRFANAASVHVHETALSDTVGTVTFEQPSGVGSGVGRVVRDGEAASDGVRTFEVPCTTLDALLAGRSDEIGLLKADIEGEEVPALRGARALFAAHRIAAAQIEYNNTWRAKGHLLGDAYAFAREHGYELLIASPLGFIRVPEYGEGLEDFRLRNLVIARPDVVTRALRPVGPAGRARVEALRARAAGSRLRG